jgi:hypothetical protein
MKPPYCELDFLSEKLHNMRVGMEEIEREREDQLRMEGGNGIVHQSERSAKGLQGDEYDDECERMKRETNVTCQRIAERYDALFKFISACPRGKYEQFVEYLLMGGGDDYYNLLCENFYDEQSEYRTLWNDNLTLGLTVSASAVFRREYVPATKTKSDINTIYPCYSLSAGSLHNPNEQKTTTFPEDGGPANISRIMQGLGSAVNAVSNLSSIALKPSRGTQVSEKQSAIKDNTDYEEALDENEDFLDVGELMRLKKEAEETCLNATIEHLLAFVKDHPNAKYHQWIEDLHPENAHDGALLEGLDKIIDHRFFVESSDHRKIWNQNLLTFLDPVTSQGRDFVPARARNIDDNGKTVVAVDILSGSNTSREATIARSVAGESEVMSSDLIQFG